MSIGRDEILDYKDVALELVELYGYWALFFTMFIDTLGIPMPSKTMLTLSGYFSHMGILNYTQIFIVAMAGTLGGFTSGYTIGRKIGTPLIEKYGRFICLTPEKTTRLEKWFEKYGPWAILIAYFLPVARSVVPYLSGISKMSFVTAIGMAAVGATCWILLLISFGLVIGQNWIVLEALLVDYYPYLIGGVLTLVAAAVWSKVRNKKGTKEVQ
ncbi:DedA family protein [Desulfallas thermosapovorans]|uniref:Membrane protein DedA with SNARE-associated domain n=1 Tax=Desulfallas thermosapovorans DSM 6562 TaxID=1121431 RepID=A0A5S4ZVX7_9FIRM|nr:DedA family protein [Desulfallas thermosapovorans]TYO97178.1 membrane protein DedA with SNARE-associated domain [Desulfallas thermosapovorans DSM 6562]